MKAIFGSSPLLIVMAIGGSRAEKQSRSLKERLRSDAMRALPQRVKRSDGADR